MNESTGADGAGPASRSGGPRLRFETANCKSSYCNMVNVTGTREEVVLNFGINQDWDQPGTAGGEMAIDLQHRVILSPFAAKRLSEALGSLVREHEARYGALK